MAVELTLEQEDFAEHIYDSGAFKTGEFKLKLHETNPNAPLSPYYISLREKDVKPGSYKPLISAMVWAFYMNMNEWVGVFDKVYDHFDRVVGIPKAGDPIAAEYFRLTRLPILTMEKDESGPTRKITSSIHGDFTPGMKILGLDDLITGADTKFEFKEGLEANELVLAHMVVGLDREQGGIHKLKEAGVSVSAALTVTELLDYYRTSNKISETDYDRIRTYIDSQN